jgi:SET domain-containing protein
MRVIQQSEFFNSKQVIMCRDDNGDGDFHIFIRANDDPETDEEVSYDWCIHRARREYNKFLDKLKEEERASRTA